MFSENKHSTVCRNLSIRFCSASVIKGPLPLIDRSGIVKSEQWRAVLRLTY